MDPSHFDTLTHSLTDARSRRGALGALLGGTLGLLGLTEATTKKNKKKKKRKNRVQTPVSPPPSPPVAPGGPTCSDGITNGSESDIDCGGSCLRCANGKTCATRSDCAGALCSGGTCTECAVNDDCGSEADGACFCLRPATGGPSGCVKRSPTGGLVVDCGACPPGTRCFNSFEPGYFACSKPCGVA